MHFNRTEDQIVLKLMTASAMRAKVIANNVANANTPGYKRQVVEFENVLQKAMEDNPESIHQVAPEIVEDLETKSSFDGNNVTLELELNAQDENRLMFELYSSILSSRSEMMRSAIDER